MKFSTIILIFFLSSCTINSTKMVNRAPFNSTGFAYIYKDQDFKNKVINGRLDNTKIQISHKDLKLNAIIKITNIKTKESLVIKNYKKIRYPDFYKILITESLAKKINLDKDLPLVEIIELKKNKSFVAKKAKIFQEEKKISSNAPVTSVEISNISKNKKNANSSSKQNKIYILIGSFYSQDTAKFLKERIVKEFPDYNVNKLKIIKKSNKNINLISGPYNAVNLMKNDYIKLKKFGFEELDITINE